MEFQDKFIGFVDILGFTQLVESAEDGSGKPLPELMELLKNLGSADDVAKFRRHGPTTCPQSKYTQPDLDFQLTQVTDCVVVSSEVSPAGAINLVNHCWSAAIGLLVEGLMCRGFITKGSIYHTDQQFVGSGYQEAYFKERDVTAFKREAAERGTPFIELDPVIVNYINNSNDQCIKKMFSRMAKSDGEITALFPFQRLSHSFIIGGFGVKFDPQKERDNNQKMRLLIRKLQSQIMEFVDKTNESAVKKAEHYVNALDDQLAVCDRIDSLIEKFS